MLYPARRMVNPTLSFTEEETEGRFALLQNRKYHKLYKGHLHILYRQTSRLHLMELQLFLLCLMDYFL